jgi:hypothetical protein
MPNRFYLVEKNGRSARAAEAMRRSEIDRYLLDGSFQAVGISR